MEGKERALHAYRKKVKTFKEKLHDCLCFVCLWTCCRKNAKEKAEDKALKFMDKFNIVVEPAEDPEHILWQNYKANKCRLCCNRFLTFLASTFLIGMFLAFLWLKAKTASEYRESYPQYLLQEIKPANESRKITAEAALADFYFKPEESDLKLQSDLRIGLMKAYCEHETLVEGRDPADITFGDGEALHCLKIQQTEDFIEFLESSECLLLALIVLLTSWAFRLTARCQKHHTTQERYKYRLKNSLVISFTVIVMLTVLASIDSGLREFDFHPTILFLAMYFELADSIEHDVN